MQECAVCHTRSEDSIEICSNCSSNLLMDSITARALKTILGNPRASAVFIVAPDHACIACRHIQGTYYKESGSIPQLPVAGCSCPGGCSCRYEPLVAEPGP
jgi:hypothetical protein